MGLPSQRATRCISYLQGSMGKVASHEKPGQIHILVGVPLLNKIIQKLVTHPHRGTVAERIEILADLMDVEVPSNIKVIEKISFLIRQYCFHRHHDEDDVLIVEIKSNL